MVTVSHLFHCHYFILLTSPSPRISSKLQNTSSWKGPTKPPEPLSAGLQLQPLVPQPTRTHPELHHSSAAFGICSCQFSYIFFIAQCFYLSRCHYKASLPSRELTTLPNLVPPNLGTQTQCPGH